MTTRYTNVKIYKTGVKRENGKGRYCILTGCTSYATVKALHRNHGFKTEVALCEFDARRGGIIK